MIPNGSSSTCGLCIFASGWPVLFVCGRVPFFVFRTLPASPMSRNHAMTSEASEANE
jgi:hypothetical protein